VHLRGYAVWFNGHSNSSIASKTVASNVEGLYSLLKDDDAYAGAAVKLGADFVLVKIHCGELR
jgi:hypothetical protein